LVSLDHGDWQAGFVSRWGMLLIGIAELLLGGAALMLAWVTPTVDPFDRTSGEP